MDIAGFRRTYRMTQAHLAGLLGVAANTVARWERGEVRPSPHVMDRLLHLAASFVRSQRGLRRAARVMNPGAPEPSDPTAALPALEAASRAAGVPLVIIGGLAVNAHGVRRLTDDADVLGPAPEDVDRYFAGGEGLGLRYLDVGPVPGTPFRRLAMTWQPRGGLPPVGVEAFLVDHEFLSQAQIRAQRFPGVPGLVATVEDIILLKTLSTREKDRLDVLSLLRARQGRIDRRYVRKWARRLGIEDAWRDMESDYASGQTGW